MLHSKCYIIFPFLFKLHLSSSFFLFKHHPLSWFFFSPASISSFTFTKPLISFFSNFLHCLQSLIYFLSLPLAVPSLLKYRWSWCRTAHDLRVSLYRCTENSPRCRALWRKEGVIKLALNISRLLLDRSTTFL